MSKLFIISAPSGAGKTTIAHALIKRLQKQRIAIERVITYTTKQPRLHEVPGKDYYFVSQHEFEQKIQENFFIEWSKAYNSYYGSPRTILTEIQQQLSSYILVIDRVGVEKIVRQEIPHISFWIEPPTFEILQDRLRSRGTEVEEQLNYRLSLAKQEMEAENDQPLCTYKIMNDLVETAVGKIEETVLLSLKTSLESCQK